LLFEKRRAVTLGGIIGERFLLQAVSLNAINNYIALYLSTCCNSSLACSGYYLSPHCCAPEPYFFTINSSAAITTVPILRPRAVYNFCAMWRIVHFSSSSHGEAVRARLDRWQALAHPREIACRSTAYATRSPRQLCRMHKRK
jgi:hypothetical protein